MKIPTYLQKIAIYCAAEKSRDSGELFAEEMESGKVNLSYWNKLIKTTFYIVTQEGRIVMLNGKQGLKSVLKEYPGCVAIPTEIFIDEVMSGNREIVF